MCSFASTIKILSDSCRTHLRLFTKLLKKKFSEFRNACKAKSSIFPRWRRLPFPRNDGGVLINAVVAGDGARVSSISQRVMIL